MDSGHACFFLLLASTVPPGASKRAHKNVIVSLPSKDYLSQDVEYRAKCLLRT